MLFVNIRWLNYLLFIFYFSQFLQPFICYKIQTTTTNTFSKTDMLNKEQQVQIRNLLNNKNLSNSMKKKIHYILYVKYEKIAFFTAYQFKEKNYYKCKYISLRELSLYSKIGLYKAIQNYNPNYQLYPFMKIYIQGELYKGITELYPICSISKEERKKRKTISREDYQNLTSDEKKLLFMKRKLYKRLIDTKFIGKEDWIIDKNRDDDFMDGSNINLQSISERDKYEKVWYQINNQSFITPFQKRIFQLKYDFYLNKIRTNREIGELMVCSEEYVRINLSRMVDKFMMTTSV